MRDEIAFLQEISEPPKRFGAAIFAQAAIDQEIQHLRHKSQSGLFHEYVKENGYPIPDRILNSESYLERKSIEQTVSKSIQLRENVILLGCEGGGKTTLIHRVVGKLAQNDSTLFIYIDVSDVDFGHQESYSDIIYDKIANAISQNISKEQREQFEKWIAGSKDNLFISSLINSASPKKLSEAFFTFLRSVDYYRTNYIILDNVDSLSLHAARLLFNVLNMTNESVRANIKALGLDDKKTVRYIICCRTPTYYHIAGHSHGLFIDFPHRVIQADDDFLLNTSVLGLLKSFVLSESENVFKNHAQSDMVINLGRLTQTLSFEEYFSDLMNWLKKSEAVFDQTIKMFCGRSIRRGKLYGLKVVASPVIARLAMFEKYGVVGITREEKAYLERRLVEAVFDFSGGIQTENLGIIGFPMNPFRVISDEADFRINPLIGIMGIDFLVRNQENIARREIYFAKTIESNPLLRFFQEIGYTETAIKDFFNACWDCGLLRPVPSSDVVIEDHLDHRDIHELYVLDDKARDSYHSLIYCHTPRLSMQFYNSVVRARYNVRADRHIDNMLYEVFTTLIFLSDMFYREDQLEVMMENSGVVTAPMTSRIRSPIMSYIGKIIQNYEEGNVPSAERVKKLRHQKELHDRVRECHSQIREKFSRRPSII